MTVVKVRKVDKRDWESADYFRMEGNATQETKQKKFLPNVASKFCNGPDA